MNTMTITLTDENGDTEEHQIPARWAICHECSGNGSHSKHLGAITADERDRDWSQDEWEDYMSGAYDQQCNTCTGTGKVLEPAYPDQEPARSWLRQCEEEAAERRADARTLYMESGGGMGYW